jgi:PAS domain S-box-containing protein
MRRKTIGAAAEDLGSKGFVNRFSIGRRLTLCFVGIFVLLFAVNGILLWQFHSAQARADLRLTGVSVELIAVLNLQSSLQSFNDSLERVAQSQNAVILRQESGPLRNMILDSVQDARNAIAHLPPEVRPYPTLIPTIEAIESALPLQLASLNSLAASGDWSALRLRLANEKQPLDQETSMLVKSITRELNEELGQTVTNIARLQRQMVIVLPLTALGTLLIAGLLGLMITRSITTPLGKLMEGSSALSRGEFDHLVPISGDDELARLGRVFNDTAGKLRSVYETLQDSKDKLEEAERITHVGYWEWDLATDCLIWSDETYRIFGLRPQERPVNVNALREMIHPEDRDRVFREKEQTIASDVRYDVEHRIVRPSGEVRVLNSTRALKKDQSGRPTHFYGTVQDITDDKRAEEELRRSLTEQQRLTEELRLSEHYLSEGQRLAHMGSWAFDTSGFFSYWSRELLRIYGLDPAQEAPSLEEYLALIHPQDREFMRSLIKKMVAEALGCDVTKRIVRPDGEIRYIRCVGVPVVEEGTLQRIIGTAMDVTDHELLTQELRRREAYLAEAQRLSRTGSFGWRPDSGEIVWSNETYCIFGYDHAVKPTIDLVAQRVYPEDRPDFLKVIENASAGAAQFEHNYRLLLPDGSVKHIHALAHASQDGSGNREFVGAVTDVTSVKRAEEELRKSEAYLAEAQRLSHTGSWAWNVGTDELFWSEEIFRIYEIDSVEEKPAWSLILARVHPDDRASLEQRRQMEATQKEWAESEADFRIVVRDGKIKHLHSVAHPVMDASGQIIEVIGTVMDVTERKRVEDSLRRSESHLAEAQKLTHTGSWIWRVPDRKALLLSEEWYRIYGFDPAEGAPVWEKRLERVHPDDRRKWKETIERAIVEKTDYDQEFRILLPNGKVKWIHTVGHPVLSDAGDLQQFVGSSTDITERKLAEQEREKLRQLEADLAHINRVSTLGEMAASLAHEIKQPIAAAITSANSCIEWLAHEPPNLDRARVAAARIDKYGNRAAEIIDRIRSFYRKSPSKRELVNVNGIVQEMLTLLNGEATRHSVVMRMELAAELPEVIADRVQLQQVFMNLMLNAIEAMKDSSGELTVKSELQDGQLQFSVSDTGAGLPTEKMDQIFSAFFTTKPQGSGMGLAISRSIVESHGGRLWATPNDGRGATFHFTLPIQVTESSPLFA